MSFANSLHSRVLLADGAMGTQLQALGLPLTTPADERSHTNPEQVRVIHADYVAAGSDLLLTNSLNANTSMFDRARVVAINRASLSLARQAGARWVAGSLGPAADELQIRTLAEMGVDLFWLETQLSLKEVLNIIALCRLIAPDTPIVVTFSFHLPDACSQAGDTPIAIADALSNQNIAALGVNCGSGFNHLAEVLTLFARHTDLPLVLKPNVGTPHINAEGWHYPYTAQEWVNHIADCLSPRVRMVGGCCGTTAAHITALRALIGH